MMDQVVSRDGGQDGNWERLFARAYEPVVADAAFKTGLFAELRAKQREIAGRGPASRDVGHDGNWSELLRRSYPPLEASREFRKNLLTALKTRLPGAGGAEARENEDAMKTLFASAYRPVEADPEFQESLRGALKRKQKTAVLLRGERRRRSIFASMASTMAAAAGIALIFWMFPGTSFPMGNPSPPEISSPFPDSVPVEGVAIPDSPADAGGIPAVAVAGGPESWSAEQAFAGFSLPPEARGVDVEFNSGDGWKRLEEGSGAVVRPGTKFRGGASDKSGIGFGNGVRLALWPDAVVMATDDGFSVEQGRVAVRTPEALDDYFRIRLPERDVAVSPGSLVAVNADFPERYSAGGVPAPEVKVLDGGFALARGKAGIGPLLAGQAYLIDNYVTPDLPGRKLSAGETAEFGGLTPLLAPSSPAAMAVNSRWERTSGGSSGSFRDGFVKDGDRWVPERYDGQATVKIPYLSDEYFGLARSRRDLAPGLALGRNVVLDAGGGTYYEIVGVP